MFSLRCPTCGHRIELDTETEEQLFRVAGCDNCDTGFDYCDEDMIPAPNPSDASLG